jgi:hypothetical protein
MSDMRRATSLRKAAVAMASGATFLGGVDDSISYI